MAEPFTDPRDGYSYKIVKLRDGNWWLAESLRYDMSGSFPADEKPNETILATNPDYDWRKYGRLYTWAAAQKASPPGWHLPSSREWKKMLKFYGGHGEGLGNDKYTGELKILVRDELDMEFGGFVDTANYQDNPPLRICHGYFHGRMGARFWSSSRALLPLKIPSGIYFRFISLDSAGRDQENAEKAFSVRCIKD
jgi:uncharacterized protein (TIGR02145 family)